MSGPLEPPSNDNQRARRSGWDRLRDADMIAALSAVVVGACALAVSIYQSMLMREQQQASVWPHIEIGREYRRENGDKHLYKLVIYNTGVGPARLVTLRVLLDGKYQSDWLGAMKALGLPQPKIQTRASVTGRVLLPGANIVALVVDDEIAANALEGVSASEPPRLDSEICYCSIYGRCYRVGFAHQEDIAVDACTRDPKIDFQE